MTFLRPKPEKGVPRAKGSQIRPALRRGTFGRLTMLYTEKATLAGIKYEISTDSENNHYARTYNEKHKIWIRLTFAQAANQKVAEDALDMLRRDHIERALG